MPPREGIPYRSVMGRGSITSSGGLAAFLPLINGVANIKKWDDKFQQVEMCLALSIFLFVNFLFIRAMSWKD
jgi:hypothetical protein